MSHGFLAKDSIQDLQAYGEEQKETEQSPPLLKKRLSLDERLEGRSVSEPTEIPTSNGHLLVTTSTGISSRTSTAASSNAPRVSGNSTTTASSSSFPSAETSNTHYHDEDDEKEEDGEQEDPPSPLDDSPTMNPPERHHAVSSFSSEKHRFLPNTFQDDDPMIASQQYHHHHHYPYYEDDGAYYSASSTLVLPSHRQLQNPPIFPKLLVCLFPWLEWKDAMEGGEQDEAELDKVPAPKEQTVTRDNTESSKEAESRNGVAAAAAHRNDTATSLGEVLSDRERQAVVARLRLAKPDKRTDHQPVSSPKQDDSLNDQSLLNEDPLRIKPLKSILKRGGSMMIQTSKEKRSSNSSLSSTTTTKSQQQRQRRSLFPTTYESKVDSKTNKNNVVFAPMARVVSVKSRNDMSADERGDIWWQRKDYEDFRKTGRIITKAMLEGGSEIWLASNESWVSKGQHKGAALKDAFQMTTTKNNISGDTISSAGDKWWHKFGHSRRGLEHVVSMDEGKQRQDNVRSAIRAVLEEQQRQRMYHREDEEKLRSVSLNHTSWARDLALASGASDADAVKSAFAQDRKSREFYLLKLARDGSGHGGSTFVHQGTCVPAFMQPTVRHVRGPSSSRIPLDSHTASQISFRRAQLHQQSAEEEKQEQPVPALEENNVPLHDVTSDSTDASLSLAHRAAGFSADEQGEKMNMAAVLSGMGGNNAVKA